MFTLFQELFPKHELKVTKQIQGTPPLLPSCTLQRLTAASVDIDSSGALHMVWNNNSTGTMKSSMLAIPQALLGQQPRISPKKSMIIGHG